MADDQDETKERAQNRHRAARVLLVGALRGEPRDRRGSRGGGTSRGPRTDGVDVENAIRAQDYDLVLMDIQMPGMDAVAATKWIRALRTRRRDIPIIAMTTPHGRPDEMVDLHAAGINDRISKPFDPSRLAAIIDPWLPDLDLAGLRRARSIRRSTMSWSRSSARKRSQAFLSKLEGQPA